MALLDRGNVVSDLGRILLKRRWTIAAFFLVVTVVVTIATLLQADIYSATAVIQIESEAPNIVGFKEVIALGAQNYWASKEYYETQFRIIRSRPVLEKVIDRLDLDQQPPFVGMDADRHARYLANIVRVAPVKSSQLVNLTVEFTDMKTAVDIANALASVYQYENFRRKSDAAQKALVWLREEQLTRTERVREKETELHDFLVEHDIVSFEERQDIVAERVRDLSDALTQAQRKRITSQVRYQKAIQFRKQDKSLAIPEVIENKLIQDLKAELVMMQKEISKAGAKWKPDHPGYKKLAQQETELKKRIDEEVGNIILSLQATYSIDLAREKKLNTELDGAKKEALALSGLEIQFRAMQREASSEGLLFDEIQKRQKETEITRSLPDISNNVRLIEEAREPERPVPVRPRRKVNVLLGALLGLMGGVGLAFVLEFLDTTIKSGEDLERTVEVPFLGIIPSFATDDETVPDELFSHRFPKSSITESVRSIRTNITFSSAGKELKRLLVTSAGPQEGKSTAVINLGIIFAQGGKRVLIVDSDLRRPRLHRAFKVSRKRGLTNLIMGEAAIEDVIVHTEVPGVDLIPCGPIPPNPSELLGTPRMLELGLELAESYDLVLFDSPPVVAVTDAVVMSKIVDGVVLIAKAGKTTSEIISKAARQLGDVSASILGTVLNDFNIRSAGYRYYYYYYHYRSREEDEVNGEEKVVRKRVRRRRENTSETEDPT
ncbi:MAG: polysaccharide biosynthesis tyrosine autokinase [Candidatus Lernaella stagnicola]|nr:polysaccharide biosynthesis tyrosine autokinase [Candidatus Lernaella stagnicola]